MQNDVQKKDGSKGAIVVEASLVFPLVLLVVIALLVLAMLEFQESVLQFGAQKAAVQAAREAAYPNYSQYIGHSGSMKVDLDEVPDEESVWAYYLNNKLYDAFQRNYGDAEGEVKLSLEEFARNFAFINGIETEADIEIQGGLSPSAKVSVEYSLRLPKFLGYIELPETWKLKAVAYSYATNSTEFVRNIDIGVDVVGFFLERLGLKGHVETFFEKLNTIADQIGG